MFTHFQKQELEPDDWRDLYGKFGHVVFHFGPEDLQLYSKNYRQGSDDRIHQEILVTPYMEGVLYQATSTRGNLDVASRFRQGLGAVRVRDYSQQHPMYQPPLIRSAFRGGRRTGFDIVPLNPIED